MSLLFKVGDLVTNDHLSSMGPTYVTKLDKSVLGVTMVEAGGRWWFEYELIPATSGTPNGVLNQTQQDIDDWMQGVSEALKEAPCDCGGFVTYGSLEPANHSPWCKVHKKVPDIADTDYWFTSDSKIDFDRIYQFIRKLRS